MHGFSERQRKLIRLEEAGKKAVRDQAFWYAGHFGIPATDLVNDLAACELAGCPEAKELLDVMSTGYGENAVSMAYDFAEATQGSEPPDSEVLKTCDRWLAEVVGDLGGTRFRADGPTRLLDHCPSGHEQVAQWTCSCRHAASC